MPQVTVRAAVPLTWLGKGDVVTVERSPLIDGALRGGHLALVSPARPAVRPRARLVAAPGPSVPPAPVEAAVAAPGPAAGPKKRASRRPRAS